QLPHAYEAWITDNAKVLAEEVRHDLPEDQAAKETARLKSDIDAWKREASLIERGVRLLIECKEAAEQLASAPASERESLGRRAAPWRAWLLMNRTFYERDARNSN